MVLGRDLAAGFLGAAHPDDDEAIRAAFEGVIASRTGYRHQPCVRRRDGVYRDMIDNASPRFGSNGEFLGLIGVLMDIEDLKDAEAARQRLEAPLRQAQKMEALGTLAGGIAHDFNNILGTIIGNVELARQDLARGPPAQQSLAEGAKASARAGELSSDPHVGRRQPDERRVIGLREAVEESTRLLRATLPAGIELATGSAHDVPNVLADPSRIHEAG